MLPLHINYYCTIAPLIHRIVSHLDVRVHLAQLVRVGPPLRSQLVAHHSGAHVGRVAALQVLARACAFTD